MNFERGLNPKYAMSVGRSKDATEIEGILVIGLARVYEEDRRWAGMSLNSVMDFGRQYEQVGEAQIKKELESYHIHCIFEEMSKGSRIIPIFDELIYLEFKRQQREEKKYTSAPVRREDMKISYHPDERSRHNDMGIHLKTKDRLWDRLHYMAGRDILFEKKFYTIPEDFSTNEF